MTVRRNTEKKKKRLRPQKLLCRRRADLMPHEENRRRLRKEHQRSRPTTIATLPWGPLEHQEGLFHPLCLAASKALHMDRSSVCNKLSVRASGTCIPSHPGRENNTTATRHHAEEGERQLSSWLGRSTSKEYETLLQLMERRDAQAGKVLIPRCHSPKGFSTIIRREIHFLTQERKPSQLPCTCVNSTMMES